MSNEMKVKYIFMLIFMSMFIIDFRISAYDAYNIGDEVKYNEHDFYVIENSSEDDDTILLLLKDYVSYDELMSLDIANKDKISSSGGFPFGETNSYEDSYIKTVVDAWSNKISIKPTHIKESRLIKYEDLLDNLGYEENFTCTTGCYYNGSLDNVPEWFKSNDSSFFTMSSVEDSNVLWMMSLNGELVSRFSQFPCRLKPVIRLYKSALTDTIPDSTDDQESNIVDNNKNNNEVKIVAVPDTLQIMSIIFTMIGIVLVSISIIMMIVIKSSNSTK